MNNQQQIDSIYLNNDYILYIVYEGWNQKDYNYI